MKGEKLLAGILSASMVICTMAFPAFADEQTANTEVSTANTLQSTVEGATTAITVKLTDNINLNDSLVIDEDQEITLDLNGKTLSIEEVQGDDGAVWYNTIKNSGKLTVTGNGTVEGQWNAISSYNGAALTIENGTFIGLHNHGIYNTGTATINAGTFEGNPDGWDLINEGGDVSINGGSFETAGVFNSGICKITNGSFITAISVDEISGGTFKSVSPKSNGYPVKVTGKISGGTFNIGKNSWSKNFLAALDNGNAVNNIKFTQNAVDAFATAAEANNSTTLLAAVSGYKFGDTPEQDNYYTINKIGTATLAVETAPVGGEIKSLSGIMKFLGSSGKLPDSVNVTKGYTLTQGTDFNNVTAVSDDEHDFIGWYIKADSSESAELITTDTTLSTFTMPEQNATLYAAFAENAEKTEIEQTYPTWIADYDSKDSFTVSSTVEMACFAKAVNEDYDFSGKTVTLTKNLDYSNKKYTPVGDNAKDANEKYTHIFRGTFDGGNFTISNIISKEQYKYAGVFGNMNGTVKNLKVADSIIYTEPTGGYAGGIAAEALGTIENCSSENVEVSGYYAGGIAAHSYGITITGITVKNISGVGFKSGAVIGYSDALTLKDAVVSEIAADSGLNGSLVGHINAGTHNISDVTVTVPEGKKALPAFATAYAANKTINLSGDNDITASNLIQEMKNATLNISSGNYTIDAVADSTGTSDKVAISGGTFSTDVSEFCDDGYAAEKDETTGQYVIKKALAWETDTDSGYYMDSDTKYGMMRFMFKTAPTGTVTDSGIKYINANDISKSVTATTANGATTFQGDVVKVPFNTTGTYYARAYITTDEETFWSEPVGCAVNWNQFFTDYTGGAQ